MSGVILMVRWCAKEGQGTLPLVVTGREMYRPLLPVVSYRKVNRGARISTRFITRHHIDNNRQVGQEETPSPWRAIRRKNDET